jgi:hypothetical protein
MMDAFAAGCQALTKIKTGGTQRVLVQHQQLVVAQSGAGVVINKGPERPSKQRTNRARGTPGRRSRNEG